MQAGYRNLRIETRAEEVEEWFENDLPEGLNKYLETVEESERRNYDFRVETLSDEADLSYELKEDSDYIDVNVEVSGGNLAVDSALKAFDELWTNSDL